MQFFDEQGMGLMHPTEEEALMSADNPNAEINIGPAYPVSVGEEIKPKLDMDITEDGGTLYMVPEDMTGNYDYKADIVSMALPDNYAERQALQEAMKMIMENAEMLSLEGYKPKIKDLLVRYLESTQYFRDADQYFEAVQQGGMYDQATQGQAPISGGVPAGGPGGPAPGAGAPKGMGGGATPPSGGVPKPFMGQPQGM